MQPCTSPIFLKLARALPAVLCLLALLAGAAPGRAAEPLPANGDTIIIGTIGDATTMIPMLSGDSASSEMSGYCYNGLVKYDKNLQLVGDLAESWTISPDNLTITFKLRKGVKWHDGKPYTSADALFSYQFMVDPKTPTPYSGDYQKVSKAEAPDPYTFRVSYKEPFAPCLESWALNQLPAHLLKGKDVRKSPLNRHPIGTGPYIFDKWEAGASVSLKANPHYWEGRPHIDQVLYRVIPDMATLFLELKAGGVDQMGLTALQYRRQTNTPFFKANYRKYRYVASAYTYLGYNLRVEKFKDRRVRQALSYAINKKEIIKGVLLGLGRVATGPYRPTVYWYNPNVKRYDYNPKKALRLLAEAGWKDTDGDGWLDKNGKRFEFTIITNNGNAYRANTAVIIQHRLKEIGVKVEVRTIEWSAFLAQFINKGRFEATLLGWTTPLDPDLFDVWHSKNAKPGGLNFIYYKNQEVDRLLVEGRRIFDRVQRKKIYDQVQEQIAIDQPYTFLYVGEALPIVSARFHNITPAPAGISYNFIKWFVPKALQRHKMAR